MSFRLNLQHLAALGLILIAVPLRAADPATATSSAKEANQKIMTRLIEDFWNGGHAELAEELFAKEVTSHYRGHVMNSSDGPAEARRILGTWRDALSGFHFAVNSMLADGDMVVAYLTFTGTHVKTLLGIAPTGKNVKVEQMFLCRMANGKIVEIWEIYDEYALRRELGDIAAPPPAPKPASATPSP